MASLAMKETIVEQQKVGITLNGDISFYFQLANLQTFKC